MLSLSKWSLDDSLSFASLVFLGCYLSHLVVLGQHRIGKGVERQRSLTVGIHNFFWKGYGTGHSVNGCDQAVGSYLRILDACIQRLFGIDAIVDSATSLLRMILCLEVVQGFMPCLIEKIHASHAYKHHF